MKLYIDHRKDLEAIYHDVYTEKVNKIAWSTNDDKRQTSDKITTYSYEKDKMMINK